MNQIWKDEPDSLMWTQIFVLMREPAAFFWLGLWWERCSTKEINRNPNQGETLLDNISHIWTLKRRWSQTVLSSRRFDEISVWRADESRKWNVWRINKDLHFRNKHKTFVSNKELWQRINQRRWGLISEETIIQHHPSAPKEEEKTRKTKEHAEKEAGARR